VSWDLRLLRGGGGVAGCGDVVARGRDVAFEIGGKTSAGPGGPRMLRVGTCGGTLGVVQTETDVDVDRPVPNGRGDLEMERILATRMAEL
jgi:hypothetical protein